MKERHFFIEHYGAIVVTSHALLVAMIIFCMAIPLVVKLLLLVVSTAVFAVTMYPTDPQELPMGTSPDLEGITRPRSEFAR